MVVRSSEGRAGGASARAWCEGAPGGRSFARGRGWARGGGGGGGGGGWGGGLEEGEVTGGGGGVGGPINPPPPTRLRSHNKTAIFPAAFPTDPLTYTSSISGATIPTMLTISVSVGSSRISGVTDQ